MKICIMIMVVAMTLIGCVPAQIQVDPVSQEVIAKIAARHVGFEVQKRYPAVAKEILYLSKNILAVGENELVTTLTDKLISVLLVKVTDPLLAMDIKDLTDLIELNIDIKITEDQIKIIKAVAGGLVSGIEL